MGRARTDVKKSGEDGRLVGCSAECSSKRWHITACLNIMNVRPSRSGGGVCEGRSVENGFRMVERQSMAET